MSTHYWLDEGTDTTDDGTLSVTSHKCKLCNTEFHIFLEKGDHWTMWAEYRYPNGDWCERYDLSIGDVCPEEFDPGSWLPGAVEI